MEFNYPDIEEIRKRLAAVTEPEQEEPISPEEGGEVPGDESAFLTGVATFFSWSLVPLFMPVYGIMLILHLSVLSYLPMQTKLITVAVIAGINAVMPMLLIYLLKFLGIVKDVALNGRKERLLPYIISIAGFGLSALYLSSHGAPRWVWGMYTGGALTALLNLVINFKWKISAHSAGIAGVVAMIFVTGACGTPQHPLSWWITGALLTAGILGSSRIYLGRHTLFQVLAGYITGFCPVFFSGMYL